MHSCKRNCYPSSITRVTAIAPLIVTIIKLILHHNDIMGMELGILEVFLIKFGTILGIVPLHTI